MSRIVRRSEIRRRRVRRAKLKRLRAKIQKASPTQVQSILEKIRRISPFYPLSNERA